MIILDTHVWVWWVHNDDNLTETQRRAILAAETDLIGVSAISCWEIAKLVERGRLILPVPVDTWLYQALAYPGIHLIPLTPDIAAESTRLPGEFHRDPADQIIVATARVNDCPVISSDRKVLNYPHVMVIG